MISRRGAKWLQTASYEHGPKNDYHPEGNPQGVVDLRGAENGFLHEELTSFFNKNSQFPSYCLTYHEGYTGTVRLRTAMANHMNIHFHPNSLLSGEDITFAAGVTDLNEVCALVTCDSDANESLLLGGPNYGGYNQDLVLRTGINPVYTLFDTDKIDQFSEACVPVYEAALEDAKDKGIDIKAIVICNPHNPLGQCYTADALIGLMQLCSRRNIHLVSDEIYGLSVYDRDDRPTEKFTSVLALDIASYIHPDYVHVLYGMSKDYGAGGLRLGCLISKNEDFKQAARAICRFSSPSFFSMDLAAKFLEDQDYVGKFLDLSVRSLSTARKFAERLLDETKIDYHRKGNAGLYMFLDLSPYLKIEEAGGDAWEAERVLGRKIRDSGVLITSGQSYHSPKPGWFRMVFSHPQPLVTEGIERISKVIHHT